MPSKTSHPNIRKRFPLTLYSNQTKWKSSFIMWEKKNCEPTNICSLRSRRQWVNSVKLAALEQKMVFLICTYLATHQTYLLKPKSFRLVISPAQYGWNANLLQSISQFFEQELTNALKLMLHNKKYRNWISESYATFRYPSEHKNLKMLKHLLNLFQVIIYGRKQVCTSIEKCNTHI